MSAIGTVTLSTTVQIAPRSPLIVSASSNTRGYLLAKRNTH